MRLPGTFCLFADILRATMFNYWPLSWKSSICRGDMCQIRDGLKYSNRIFLAATSKQIQIAVVTFIFNEMIYKLLE